jgi:EAL domain-containing protein (putative c-di-GMP-specific phosphodiesterase class I)
MPATQKIIDVINTARESGEAGSSIVQRALEALRIHFNMDVAYVSEFVGDRSVFRQVDAPGLEELIKPDDSQSLDDVYCRYILEGRLPELIPDTSKEPVAASMPITSALPIGAHMSVPVRMPDGTTYGMFCCLSFEPKESLNERDLRMMRVFADLAAFEIHRELEAKREVEEKLSRIREVIDEEKLSIVFQPIRDLEMRSTIGLECLSRISATPERTPDLWFAEAGEAGLGEELELVALGEALSVLSAFPEDLYLSVNASPDVVLSERFHALLSDKPVERIVLELTEHAHVADYDRLVEVLRPLRERGMRLAVDDAGAGYSTLQHILQLRPDLIKLDITLTRCIDLDPARQALASALVSFSRNIDSRIVAEGIETESELRALRKLGIDAAQGYHLARPMALEAVLSYLAMGRRERRVA